MLFNLIPNTREKHDVPESKQGFTLMSPVIIQQNSGVLGKAVENSFSIKTGGGVMGAEWNTWAQVSVVLTLLSACFCNVSSSSLGAQPVVSAGRAGSRQGCRYRSQALPPDLAAFPDLRNWKL